MDLLARRPQKPLSESHLGVGVLSVSRPILLTCCPANKCLLLSSAANLGVDVLALLCQAVQEAWHQHLLSFWGAFRKLPIMVEGEEGAGISHRKSRNKSLRELLHCWWERKLVQPLWKTVWRKVELPFDLAIPLLGIYPEENKSLYEKDTCTCMFIAAQFAIAKTWNQPKCPQIKKWIKKLWCMYMIEYYSAIKGMN
uniref:Uncharacterized protein n=2 Tax=Macaca TaxID=9539 RepID=A0A7N9C9W3_MACFA